MARKKLRRGEVGSKHINEAIGAIDVTLTVGTETEVDIDLDSGDASWTASGSGTDEYHYDTAIATVHGVKVGGVALVLGTISSLAKGEYAVGDADTIGSDTVYVRLPTGGPDPDTDPSAVSYSVEESVSLAGQVIDKNGDAIAEAVLLTVMISDAPTGLGIAGTAPDTVTAVTGSIVDSPVSKKLITVQTTAAGAFSLLIEENGADVWYVAVFVGTNMTVSDAVTFV